MLEYHLPSVDGTYGGMAQLARAIGSYPIGRWFKSTCRYQKNIYNMEYGPLVKRLRHRPFTAETGVRFSYGSPIKKMPYFIRHLFYLIGNYAN